MDLNMSYILVKVFSNEIPNNISKINKETKENLKNSIKNLKNSNNNLDKECLIEIENKLTEFIKFSDISSMEDVVDILKVLSKDNLDTRIRLKIKQEFDFEKHLCLMRNSFYLNLLTINDLEELIFVKIRNMFDSIANNIFDHQKISDLKKIYHYINLIKDANLEISKKLKDLTYKNLEYSFDLFENNNIQLIIENIDDISPFEISSLTLFFERIFLSNEKEINVRINALEIWKNLVENNEESFSVSKDRIEKYHKLPKEIKEKLIEYLLSSKYNHLKEIGDEIKCIFDLFENNNIQLIIENIADIPSFEISSLRIFFEKIFLNIDEKINIRINALNIWINIIEKNNESIIISKEAIKYRNLHENIKEKLIEYLLSSKQNKLKEFGKIIKTDRRKGKEKPRREQQAKNESTWVKNPNWHDGGGSTVVIDPYGNLVKKSDMLPPTQG
ncbi:MAG: hypothetical protein AB7I41_22320 [Candidatus Sericytochromatia bacterium]